MIGYVKHFDSKLLKKYKKLWEKVGNLLSIEFNSELVYGDVDKYIKTKIKNYGYKVNTHFQGQKGQKGVKKKMLHINAYH